MPGKLRVRLHKSPISYTAKTRGTVRALGLHRLHETVEVPDNPATRGMVRAVRFLVEVESIPATPEPESPAHHRTAASRSKAAAAPATAPAASATAPAASATAPAASAPAAPEAADPVAGAAGPAAASDEPAPAVEEERA